MSYEQELASRYSKAHNRLWGPPPEVKKYIPPKIVEPEIPPPPPIPDTPYLPKVIPTIPRICGRPTFKQLLIWVSKRENVERRVLVGPYRDHFTTHARKILYFLARRYAGANFPQIAKWLKRDHTTVISGFYKIKARIESDAEFAEHMRGYTDAIEHQMQREVHICPLCGK